jgi:hypothetical protein
MHSEHPIPIDDYTSACSDKPSKARKVALADVLWQAANEWLVSPLERHEPGKWLGSCCAVMTVLAPTWYLRGATLHEAAKSLPAFWFLKDLGCDTHTQAMQWQEDPQGVRYMWLLLAAHVAEDEGIEIEVSP